jgi:protein-tyrosine kinase
MSIVERAAKRLEELEKARAPAVQPASYPSSAEDISEAHVPDAPRLDGSSEKPLSHERRTAHHNGERSAESRTDRPVAGTPARLEPRLSGIFDSSSSDALLRQRTLPIRKHRLDIDFSRLVDAGYLQMEDGDSQTANEFRKIKRPLIQACQGKVAPPVQNASRIMITSALPREGKTAVALNLALSIAKERDSTVLLIDADTTQQNLSRVIGMDSRPGLLDLVADRNVRATDALLDTNVDRLSLLPLGMRREHATELLASEAMARLIAELASEFRDRILLFDAPPLLGAPEPPVLAHHMGQIVVVVEAERTTHKVLTDALLTIQSCPRIAMVLNKAPQLSIRLR